MYVFYRFNYNGFGLCDNPIISSKMNMKKSDLKVGTVLNKNNVQLVVLAVVGDEVVYCHKTHPNPDPNHSIPYDVLALNVKELERRGYLEEEEEKEEFKEGKKFYFVDADGEIDYDLYSKDNVFNQKLISIGNAHHTEKEAKNSELYKFLNK